jgi:hypothetical protein
MRLLMPTTVLMCLLLAACGADDGAGDAAPSATDAATANTDDAIAAAGDTPADAPLEPGATTLPTGDFRVASVSLGREIDGEGQVRTPLEVFKPTDRIHAAVVGIGSSEGLTLSARWTTADGTEIAKAGQSLVPTVPTVTTFAIAQPEPWPAGAYRVEIAINDRVVETRAFVVE